jgi:hypothetical protein
MTRTTVDIDPTVLSEAKALARKRGKTLGDTISVLLAEALARQQAAPLPEFRWSSQSMGTHIPFEDKEALWDALDASDAELRGDDGK